VDSAFTDCLKTIVDYFSGMKIIKYFAPPER